MTANFSVELCNRPVKCPPSGERGSIRRLGWHGRRVREAASAGAAAGRDARYGRAAAGVAAQFRGSSSARRRLGCVGMRASTSRR